jgi:glycosyltransferase involved in cell wall biosynthesis
MSKPFFSIVIPTRQRHETLPFAIKTVLQQEFDDYEIVVADNCSSSETYEVVHSFNNPKIKYFRSEIPLAMSDNWEFAISKVQGEYVIVFGDDDGLIPNSLGFLRNLIENTQFNVIRWNRVYYSTPNMQPPEFSNSLQIPLPGNNYVYIGNSVINSTIHFKSSYTILPMLYNSVIRRSLIDELINKTGRIFQSLTPDVYSGFALAYISKSYLSIGIPCSINGASPKSNGVSHAYQTRGNAIIRDFIELNASSNLNFHSKIPNVRSITASVMETFFQFKDHFNTSQFTENIEKIYRKILEDVVVFDLQEQKECINLLREKIINNKDLIHLINSDAWKAFKPKVRNSNVAQTLKNGFYKQEGFLILDASKFRVSNVYEASKLVSNFYDFSTSDLHIEHFRKPLRSRLYRRISSALNILING